MTNRSKCQVLSEAKKTVGTILFLYYYNGFVYYMGFIITVSFLVRCCQKVQTKNGKMLPKMDK